ncbi:MAG: YigZ family protein [Planctomycetes bacterium]|nr:YigZ family protein [Planctomycetota bacterium]
MSERYAIPAGEHEHEIAVQRSRFRAAIAPAASVEDARAFVRSIRDRYPDATHHCWAYLVGAPGATDRVGMSDDGEPHGTAGRPMLKVLSHAPIGDVVVVVTRWYGGTKLGTGGLARAYGEAVQQVLAVAPRAERIEWQELDVELDYAAVEPLRRMLPAHEAEIIDESWTERAAMRLRLPLERVEAFRAQVIEMSNGTARVT